MSGERRLVDRLVGWKQKLREAIQLLERQDDDLKVAYVRRDDRPELFEGAELLAVVEVE